MSTISRLISKYILLSQKSHLSTSKPLAPFEECLVEDLPEDGGHEAVDEEVDGWVDDHAQLGDVTHQKNPKWQTVAVVSQGFFEVLNCENLKTKVTLITRVPRFLLFSTSSVPKKKSHSNFPIGLSWTSFNFILIHILGNGNVTNKGNL